jgi:hypothetical protein
MEDGFAFKENIKKVSEKKSLSDDIDVNTY